MIGVGSAQPVERLLADVRDFQREALGHPFGIGLMTWAVSARPELLDAAIASRPFAIALSFGDPAPFAARIRAAGIELISQVQDRASALAAQAAGATLLVAQGTEAGGHTGVVGTLPLLQIVLDIATVPVVAAGGVASGRGLAAVLAAGAEGAWIGTPFLVALEARNDSSARERLVRAQETATVLTSVFDVAQGIPWPAEFRGRALGNAFTERWSGREAELAADGEARAGLAFAVRAADTSLAPIYAGQTVGMLNHVEPAADILRRIEHDAEQRLRAVRRVVDERA